MSTAWQGRWPAAICLCLAITGPSACRPAASAPHVGVEWRVTPDPPLVGPSRLVLTLHDTDRRLLAGATVRIEGHMTHPGMPPVLAAATEQAAGQYHATLVFSMAGDWTLLVKGTLADGRPLNARIDIGRVEAGH